MVSPRTTEDAQRQVQRHLSDLTAVLALPAMWKGRDPRSIAADMLDVLGGLLRPEFVHARLSAPPDGCPEIDDRWPRAPSPSRALTVSPEDGPPRREALSVRVVSDPSGGGSLRIATLDQQILGSPWRVVVGSRRPDFPTESERFLLTVAVEQATIAIETAAILSREQAGRVAAERARADAVQARAEAEAERQRLREESQIVETLHRIGRALAAELELETLVQLVTDAATELSDARFGAFFYNVAGDEGESYRLYTLSGAPREAFERFPLPRNTPIFEPTFRGTGVVRLDDVSQDPRYGQLPPHHGLPAGHLPVRSYLAVPVISRSGEVLGGLFFGHPEPGVFTERAERLVVGIAAQAAVAIDNAQLYRQAREAIQLRDDFLSVASHELRTPLATLRGHAQMVLRRFRKDGALDQDRAVRALQAIADQSDRLTSLINQLLDISRIEAGKLALEPREADLVGLVDEVVAAARARTDRHAIGLRAPSELRREIDPLRLEQVLTNLLDNAINYSPDGGPIEVEVSDADQAGATIAVRDYGVGIPPDKRAQIFERFYQAHGEGQRGGMGLGLYISRQIVELHGGELRVEFPTDGGTRFVVRLPVAPTEALPAVT